MIFALNESWQKWSKFFFLIPSLWEIFLIDVSMWLYYWIHKNYNEIKFYCVHSWRPQPLSSTMELLRGRWFHMVLHPLHTPCSRKWSTDPRETPFWSNFCMVLLDFTFYKPKSKSPYRHQFDVEVPSSLECAYPSPTLPSPLHLFQCSLAYLHLYPNQAWLLYILATVW